MLRLHPIGLQPCSMKCQILQPTNHIPHLAAILRGLTLPERELKWWDYSMFSTLAVRTDMRCTSRFTFCDNTL